MKKPGNAGGAKGSRKMDGEMTRRTEAPPATVPRAQQAGAAHPLWGCAKPCVWTMRMLTALIEGGEAETNRPFLPLFAFSGWSD